MTNITMHNGKTIIFSGEVDDEWVVPDGCEFEVIFDLLSNIDTHCVVDGVVVLKSEQQTTIYRTNLTANGIDLTTITNLPNPSTVTVNGQVVTVEDGTLELTFDVPGDYLVKVESFPYLPWEVTIHAS